MAPARGGFPTLTCGNGTPRVDGQPSIWKSHLLTIYFSALFLQSTESQHVEKVLPVAVCDVLSHCTPPTPAKEGTMVPGT